MDCPCLLIPKTKAILHVPLASTCGEKPRGLFTGYGDMHSLKAALRLSSLLFTCISFLVVSIPQAQATVFRIFGAGPRAIGMGGAFCAVADDFTGGYYNPGGLLASRKTRIGLGYHYSKLSFEENGTSIPLDRSHRDGAILGFAFTLPFIGALDDKIAFGYNLFQPIDYVMNISVPQPSQPQFVLMDSYTQANIMHIALAVDVYRGIAVGAGAHFTSDLGGSLDLKPGIRGMLGTNVIMTTVDQDAQPIITPTAGLMLTPGKVYKSLEGLTIGFVWRDRYFLDLNIPVTILLGSIPLRLDFTSKLVYTPRTYTVGMAYRFSEDLLVAAELSYYEWSKFLSPSLRIATEIKIPLIPIELLPGVVEDPGFSDTWSPRVGFEYRGVKREAFNLVFRGGYAYDPSPVPEQTGWSNFLDGDKHIFSTGVGLELKQLFGKDVSGASPALQTVFQYQWIRRTTHTKAQDIQTFNPGYPSITGEGEVLFLGFAITMEYGGI